MIEQLKRILEADKVSEERDLTVHEYVDIGCRAPEALRTLLKVIKVQREALEFYGNRENYLTADEAGEYEEPFKGLVGDLDGIVMTLIDEAGTLFGLARDSARIFTHRACEIEGIGFGVLQVPAGIGWTLAGITPTSTTTFKVVQGTAKP